MTDFTKAKLAEAKKILEGNVKEQVAEAAKAVNEATDASALDSAEVGTKLPKMPPFDYEKEHRAIQAKLDKEKNDVGNTLHDPSLYKDRGSFEPATEASVDRTRGLRSQISGSDQTYNDSRARPATSIDLANLDETNVMSVPFLETKSFEVMDIMSVHPVDPALRFRWANFKNQEGAQYATLKAMGFENCLPEDCKEADLMKSLVKEDGSIKYFDVVLVKINVLILMSKYKKNIMKSMNRVGKWDEGAIKEANATFNNSLSQDLKNAMKRQGYDVGFYSPTMGEVRGQNKGFGGY